MSVLDNINQNKAVSDRMRVSSLDINAYTGGSTPQNMYLGQDEDDDDDDIPDSALVSDIAAQDLVDAINDKSTANLSKPQVVEAVDCYDTPSCAEPIDTESSPEQPAEETDVNEKSDISKSKIYAILAIVGIVALIILFTFLSNLINGTGHDVSDAAQSSAPDTMQADIGSSAVRYSNAYVELRDTQKYVDSMQMTKFFEISGSGCHFYITGLASNAKQTVTIEVSLDQYNAHVDGEIIRVLYNQIILGKQAYLINLQILEEN